MKEIKILMFGHGTHENHGCEAIVRSTAHLVTKKIKNNCIKVASYAPEKDRQIKIDGVGEYIPHLTPIRKYSTSWLQSIIYNKIKRDYEASYQISQKEVVNEIQKSDICLSVGGDNYCYGDPVHLYALSIAAKKAGKRLVLWGASVETDEISERMKEDLSSFDALFVRESITHSKLNELGLGKKLYLYPDPAFTMEKAEVAPIEDWKSGKMVGLNLSPLIMKYEKNSGTAFEAFNQLIEYIIKQTDLNIALIPHVVIEGNSDFDVLNELYQKFKQTNRVILLGTQFTAPQLKGYISKCKFFIGARTHATIAAYSTCVPTLVVGYSVKARGIARDLFGSEGNYVLPIQTLTDSKQLIEGFNYLQMHEQEIRNHLTKVIPEYKDKAASAVTKLSEII